MADKGKRSHDNQEKKGDTEMLMKLVKKSFIREYGWLDAAIGDYSG
jgi:hypothetical protein